MDDELISQLIRKKCAESITEIIGRCRRFHAMQLENGPLFTLVSYFVFYTFSFFCISYFVCAGFCDGKPLKISL